MPSAAPLICSCGKVTPRGVRCACKAVADRQRKARFDARRPSPTNRGYDAAWRLARREFLIEHPICGHGGCNALATHVHHTIAHKGNTRLFWDRSKWQALCAHHHNADAQRAEARS